MSKITFRADDDLIEQLEAFDASKSEVLREALREYLGDSADAHERKTVPSTTVEESDAGGALDALIADRVDELVTDRLNQSFTRPQPQDINVNIALDGESATATATDDGTATPADGTGNPDVSKTEPAVSDPGSDEVAQPCSQCGESVSADHVYCPNCGEKASQRVFCDCGDELRSDWGFCPGCGRRTPAADVLDQT